MSSGGSKSTSETRSLSSTERANLFNSQLGLFSSALGNQQVTPRNYATSAAGQSTGYSSGKVNTDGHSDPIMYGTFGKYTARTGEGLGNDDPYTSLYTLNTPKYDSQTYVDSGNMRTLSNGDYDKLQQGIIDSSLAPMQRMETLQRQNVDQSAADRGIWSSGLAIEAQNDVTERLAPQYASLGGQAVQQRYNLQSAEQQALNQYAIDDAAKRNAFNENQALQNYTSDWAPWQYLKELYSGTAGTASASNDADFDFGIAI